MTTSLANPQVGEKINIYGYSFVWTEAHLSKDDIEPLRQQYDTLATAALERLQAVRAALLEESKLKGTSPPPNDLYTILRDHRGDDIILAKFWDEVNTVPSWVDWEQLQRGQRFFYRYALANIIGFALQGFMAENSSAPGVVEVLVRTGGFSTRMLLGRLLETFQWLIQVTHSIAAIQPDGEGHIATIRVRLLHASVRQRILQLCRTRPSYFDTERFGVPVNLLDGIHSISTFCCNPMWLQLPKFGITPSTEEISDYIALFRYLGFLLGTPTSYFETAEKGKIAMESFLFHELGITDTSRTVAFNFLHCVTNLPPPFHVSKGFVGAGSRWINGNELCDELELARPNYIFYLAFAGHCLLVTLLAWLQRIVPSVDAAVINFSRSQMYHGVVQRRAKTRFDFKYIPHLGKRTGKELNRLDEAARGRKFLCFGSHQVGVLDIGYFEMVLLLVTSVIGGVVGGVGWMMYRAIYSGVVR